MGAVDIESNVLRTSSRSSSIPSPSKSPATISYPAEAAVEEDPSSLIEKYGQTQRGLSARHVQLMAIGGSIGTGLFVGIGSSLRTAGPLSVVLAYLIYPTLFIWACNMCVAEMATHLPIRGSVFEFATRYVDPAFGFALGWTYFYASAMLYCAEISAVATVMGYWDTGISSAVWVVSCPRIVS